MKPMYTLFLRLVFASFLFSFFVTPLYSSIVQGTLIATPSGNRPVQDLQVGDVVLNCDPLSGVIAESKINVVSVLEISQIVLILTDDSLIIPAAPDQCMFDPVATRWINAENLTSKNYLVDRNGKNLKCLDVLKVSLKNSSVKAYCLTTEHPYTLLTTEKQIVTHNFIPIAIGISLSFGETLASVAFTGIAVAIGSIFGGVSKGKSYAGVNPLQELPLHPE